MSDFDFALDRIRLGIKKNGSVSEKNKINTAYHEAGHTLISLLTKGAS